MRFEELLEKYRNNVEAYVKYKVSFASDRDDLLQEIYLQAYEKFNTLNNGEAFKAWILTIARNKVNDYYRSRARDMSVPLEENIPVVSIHRTVDETVRETLRSLSVSDREILYLFYWDELSLKEISERLKLPEGTIKSRLHYARKRFKERYPKEELMNKKLPDIMPEYTISERNDRPFEVLWEELMGWFLIPKEGNRIGWAIYDFPERKRSETYEMRCKGKAEIHGLEGVTVEAIESYDRKQIKRHFIAQLTDTHCRYLAERHEEDGVMKYYTFLDGDAFLNNWGFGPDNIGNETHLRQKGLITRNGNVITTQDNKETMDVVGRYDVTINGKTYDTICLMDVCTYDEYTVSEQYIDRNGHTVLWRRFNRKNRRWLFDRFESVDGLKLQGNEKLIVNGEECLHWYDCITEYVL
ncbi:MAG: sigma-70 family RNA polymerase sigma factor [Erysipelotrichaceae bacterium]|nr:sigma-70 family RNA polymerase sigma factor [Erysipelotrichaceae bacterium]